MRIYTVVDNSFLQMGKAFVNSCQYYSKVPITICTTSKSNQVIDYCKSKKIHCHILDLDYSNKQASRLLKMSCADVHDDEDPIIYMDADIVFQNDISSIEDLNSNYIWSLSKREGHQTSLRTWKKHYFSKSNFEFAKEALSQLSSWDVNELLKFPVRNCGVLYGNRKLLSIFLKKAKSYYLKILDINKKNIMFSDSDQLSFLLAFYEFQDKIKELPLIFNRMPYHQSYDFKDMSSFVVPDNVVLHFNRCKSSSKYIVDSWSKNKKPIIKVEENTRSGIIIPMQTSNVAERALTKNLYFLSVCNKANIYRDEDVGYVISKRIDKLDIIRNSLKEERPAFDRGLFFMINDFLFMIDHGEKIGKRAAWRMGKYVNFHQLAGIFVEQMDKDLDFSESKIPIFPLTYGAKQPLLWLNQGIYHNLGVNSDKKYSIHFIGNCGTNKERKQQAEVIKKTSNSKIEDRKNNKRLSFDEYMRDMALSKMVWCPPGGRPKTHREVEAMCCELAIVMPKQDIIESEPLIPDVHYICIKNDYSDVVKKIEYYLENEKERKEIAHNGRLWWERNASDSARSKYILNCCLDTIIEI